MSDDTTNGDQARLRTFDALLLAAERRLDVLRIVAASAGAEEAAIGIQQALDVDEPEAIAILGMQLQRLTVAGVTRMKVERDRIRATLDADREE